MPPDERLPKEVSLEKGVSGKPHAGQFNLLSSGGHPTVRFLQRGIGPFDLDHEEDRRILKRIMQPDD